MQSTFETTHIYAGSHLYGLSVEMYCTGLFSLNRERFGREALDIGILIDMFGK